MKLKEKIKEKLNSNERTRKLLEYDFRTIVFTVVSLVITTAYAAFYTILGIMSFSVWYGMLALYYIMIVGMRAIVVFYHQSSRKRKEFKEYKENISRVKIYRSCGIVISLLTLPLSIAILLMVKEHSTFSHAGLMIYVASTYTAGKAVMTIRHIVKARKSTDMTVRTVRCINLADMFVSILALQTAMFNSFSPEGNWAVMNAATGAVVCLATVIIGVYMIANSKRVITKINYEQNLQKSKEINEEK